MTDIFDLEKAKQAEAERRFAMLGDLQNVSKRDYSSLRDRAKETLVPAQILLKWCQVYDEHSIEGLKPNWSKLSNKAEDSISTIYNQIESIANEEIITKDQISELAKKLGWKISRVRRWLRRYRSGGLWNLAPKSRTQTDRDVTAKVKRLPRDVGTLDEEDLQEMFRRCRVLGILAEKSKPSSEEWCRLRLSSARCSGIKMSYPATFIPWDRPLGDRLFRIRRAWPGVLPVAATAFQAL